LGEGIATLEITNKELKDLRDTAEVIPRFLKRSVDDWERVQRATFFMRTKGLMQKAMSANVWTPPAYHYAQRLGRMLDRDAEDFHIPELKTNFNRIGFNFMNGSPHHEARIPMHTDPEKLHGVVAIVGLEGYAEATPLALGRNMTVTLLACRNLCAVAGIEPVGHEVIATERRTSMTLAEIV
jgi:hypothetical protein